MKKGGYKISALDIESVLLQDKNIREACVFSIPCEKYGEEIVAFIVPATDDTKLS